ncbi:MAG TPA: lanthionine synthetase LanC family protein, partial [Candidatus Hydrogenedentes bacterium]|nr:lanthionine synthetase LanC family protein [Candidatus Hydrogenedentota bacterium]
VEAVFRPSEVACDGIWLRVRKSRLNPEIRSGWKLHLSAAPAIVRALLAAALPVLASTGLSFKLVRSLDVLEDLNDGRYGLTQVGKAVTVYPPDEAAALDVAARLREALRGLDGPDVPTDFRVYADAPVYCRFGPFDYRVRIDALGRQQRLLAHPERGDVVDPADGGDADPAIPILLPRNAPADHLAFLRDEYLFVRLLHLTAKGGVFGAVSRRAPSSGLLLVKTARKGANSDRFGRDALWAARHEHALLRDLAGDPGAPPCPELLCDGDRTIALVRPWLAGRTFWELWTSPDAATDAARQRMATCLRLLASAVLRAHERGIVVRDLAPANVLEEDGAVVILDWELAHRVGSDVPPYRRGTPGFYNPARDRFRAPDLEDDHYALLALAFMVASGVHPILLLSALREAGVAGPFLAPGVRETWRRACSQSADPAGFRQSFAILMDAISATAGDASVQETSLDVAALREALWDDLLRSVGSFTGDIDDATVYSGVAGRMIVAMECGLEPLRTPEGIDRVRPLLRRLLDEAAAVRHIPGLHFGLPGVALACAVAGRLWEDAALETSALQALTQLELPASPSPDLSHGLAGYVVALLAAHGVTRDGPCLDAAVQAGNRLLQAAARDGEDTFWPWPEGPYGSMSGARLFGFAHGVAGVGYALLRLVEVTGDDAFRRAAEAAIDTLRCHARPLDAANAVWWAVSPTDETVWNAWCHGTPGVVKTLSLAAAVLGRDADRELLERALRGVYVANNPGFCLCHGIASRLDAALDAAAWTPLPAGAHRDAAILAALDLPALEEAAHGIEKSGRSRGLMTGAAGVRRALIRYAGGTRGPFGIILP